MAPNRRRTVAKLLRAIGFARVLCFLSSRERALTAFILVLLLIIYVRSSIFLSETNRKTKQKNTHIGKIIVHASLGN